MSFFIQQGKIFGFGPEAEEIQKLDTTVTHNLGDEQSVGLMNYELGIQVKSNLKTYSRKLILNKSFDLLEKSGKLSDYRLFRKASLEKIDENRLE